ncbi:tetratricopeptide repeat-containing sensor histidine kinase [Flavobacterium capsici]|uniref:histidine kinase n=1 Tax=Flavobacterium capsici TaxID=3075618 RepID=A0AA96J8Y7_9FLAO|nr:MULTISPECIES: tetratricopeptide repeat protein [unclassified Flavobacterium]WNM19919.1 tetratricopeptide repeat protein [Flavobacterium sp. PMR2A8]WNM21308.1 tetratricopeptide repeat protein [Flavobacterium sp. PMTSA4]
MRFYCCLFVLLLSINSFSQASKTIDDLTAELQKNTKQDTLKVVTLLKLSTTNSGLNPEKMKQFAIDAMQLSEKINYKKGIGESFKLQGASYFSIGDYKNAEKFFSKSLAVFEDIKYNAGIIICNSNLGSIKLVQNKYPEALQFYQTSIRYAEKTNSSKYSALAYGNMGIIYSELKNYNLALKHFNEALNIHKKSNYAAGIASSLSNIGNVYFNKKEYDNALDFFTQALTKNIENNDKLGMSREYGNIANVYSEQKKYSDSFENHMKALKINEELKNKKGLAVNYQGIGEYYLKQNNLDQSLDYFKKANQISKQINVDDLQKQSFNSLSEVFEKKGNLDSAYFYFKKYIDIKETIDNEANRKQISRLEIQYEFDTKEEKYKTQQLLDNENIKQQKLLLELNKSKLNESNKERDLVRLNYLKTQSELKNESLEKKAQKKQLTIAEKEIELNKITLENKEKQKWYFIAGLLLLGIIGSLLYFQNQNRKKTNKKLQLLNDELEQANKAKTRFFSILNHDLRGPVANLINFLQLQKESPELLDKESTERMQNKTMESAENLLNSMEDILQWSKSQMENFKPQPKTIYINDLFEDIENHFSSFENIKIEFINPENISLKTDKNYLKTIVRNLTGNAIKALNGTQSPTIVWKAWEENNNSFLSIIDNGKGAELDQFKALYDDKEVVGIKSGLGLHLIRDLSKAIDCKIEVDSKKDVGTTFILTFIK